MTHSSGAVAGLLVLVLSACAGSPRAQPGAADNPSPARGAEGSVLRPGDALQINVWPERELSGEFVVEETGYVYLPYLQAVRAAGVSLDELRDELRRGYGEMMRNPVVTITPVFRVTVMGEVQRPGVYSISPTHSLFDVMGMAGGFRAAADQENVRIVRPGQVIRYDAFRALELGEGLDDIELRSGDQIVVPARRGRDWRAILTVVQTISLLVVTWERLSR